MTTPFRRGNFVGDLDPGTVFPERNLVLPYVVNPAYTYLDYDCYLEIQLDSGMAMHKPLPQSNPTVDTLSTVDAFSRELDSDIGEDGSGVNLQSFNLSPDIIQRMATSTYKFILRGFGIRAVYQVPIPSLVRVGNNPAVPEGTQRAFNKVVANFSGIPVFYAQWALPYMIVGPLGQSSQIAREQAGLVPPNPSLHIRADVQLPPGIILPKTTTDRHATKQVGQATLKTRTR